MSQNEHFHMIALAASSVESQSSGIIKPLASLTNKVTLAPHN